MHISRPSLMALLTALLSAAFSTIFVALLYDNFYRTWIGNLVFISALCTLTISTKTRLGVFQILGSWIFLSVLSISVEMAQFVYLRDASGVVARVDPLFSFGWYPSGPDVPFVLGIIVWAATLLLTLVGVVAITNGVRLIARGHCQRKCTDR